MVNPSNTEAGIEQNCKLYCEVPIYVASRGVDNTAATLIYQKSPIDAGGHYGYRNCICHSQKKILSRLRSQYGITCGTASTITKGSRLCKIKAVVQLNKWIISNSETTKKLE
ncbi:MAG: hypothetical protein V7670_11560 [Maribacter arcticus]|uniref:hypothetical protein n=1 Tax=Maribacter arcticus TaxID=561365 RepID=UPI0030027A18